MEFYPGFEIDVNYSSMQFVYGQNVFGPQTEKRLLEEIRKSLKDPQSDGPKIPYAIAMDVGRALDQEDLVKRNLLFGAVIYSKGKMGNELVRSQGHTHGVSVSSGTSTPEVYEIWDGQAIIYMQEKTQDNPGKCYAVYADAGEVVIVPPNWAHYAANANPLKAMTFGAWCIRDYIFDYEEVRAHRGLAYFPVLKNENIIDWQSNDRYQASVFSIKKPYNYKELGLQKGIPIYTQYIENKNLFNFVTAPSGYKNIWQKFVP